MTLARMKAPASQRSLLSVSYSIQRPLAWFSLAAALTSAVGRGSGNVICARA